MAGLAAEGAHRGDDLETRAHRALRVVLVGGRRAPHRHHRVADELLDGPAVALDDVARPVEVAAKELADLLRVAPLGEGGESHEVDEEDRAQPPLRRRGRGVRARRRRRRGGDRGAAVGAEPRARRELRAAARARRGQGRPAVRAESLAVRRLAGAGRTAHHLPPGQVVIVGRAAGARGYSCSPARITVTAVPMTGSVKTVMALPGTGISSTSTEPPARVTVSRTRSSESVM